MRAKLLRDGDVRVLWSEQYLHEVVSLSMVVIKNDIASQIATAAGQRYGLVQTEVRDRLSMDDENASLIGYACVAQAQIYQRTYSDEEYTAARQCLEDTVVREPGYARA